MPKKADYTKEILEVAVKDAFSFRAVQRNLGLVPHSQGNKQLKQLMDQYGIDYTHFDPRKHVKVHRDNVLVLKPNGSNRTMAVTLKRALFQNGVEDKCSGPNCLVIDTWNGSPITLQVDHINGNPLDDRFENLRLLCPNCHSQTSTFGIGNRTKVERKIYYCTCGEVAYREGRSCKKCDRASRSNLRPERETVSWPSLNELIEMKKSMTFKEIGDIVGVSAAAVSSRIKRHKKHQEADVND